MPRRATLGAARCFANAQTGNIVLLSSNMHVRWASGIGRLRYLVPLCAFALGVLVAEEHAPESFATMQRLHWRQLVVLGEDRFCCSLWVFTAGAESAGQRHRFPSPAPCRCRRFRKVNGYAFASTMCIGNLRSGMDFLVAFGHTRIKACCSIDHSVSSLSLRWVPAWVPERAALRAKTIWPVPHLLAVSLCFMFIKEDSQG